MTSFDCLLLRIDNRKFGLRCTYCLPIHKIIERVVCPTTTQITFCIYINFQYIIDYPQLESNPILQPSSAYLVKLQDRLSTIEQLSNNNVVEIKNRLAMRHVGNMVGKLVAMKVDKSDILTGQNQLYY